MNKQVTNEYHIYLCLGKGHASAEQGISKKLVPSSTLRVDLLSVIRGEMVLDGSKVSIQILVNTKASNDLKK